MTENRKVEPNPGGRDAVLQGIKQGVQLKKVEALPNVKNLTLADQVLPLRPYLKMTLIVLCFLALTKPYCLYIYIYI